MQQSIISVQFNNQSLLATLVNDVPHVALKPICENLGIDWEAQRQKIERHPVLNSTTCMIKAVAQDGKLREMLMMPIKFLNGWLFLIDASRVKAEAKETVIKYQRECFDVLANHFMPKQPTSTVISAKDRMTLKDAVNKYCYSAKESQQAVYWRLFRQYGVDKVELLPAGKLNEMLIFLGLQKPEYDDYVLMKQRDILALEQKAKALPAPVQKVEPIAAGCVVITLEMFKKYEKLQEKLNSIWFVLDR